MATAQEPTQCSLLPRALGLVLMQAQADRRITDERFASCAGMSVQDLRDVLRGELELPLGGYIKLAVAVGTPLGALLLEAERLAETLQAPSKNDDRRS